MKSLTYPATMTAHITLIFLSLFISTSLCAQQVTPLNVQDLSSIEKQRENYQSAKKMLSLGNFYKYSQYRNKVGNYALAPYLDHQSLLLQFQNKNPKDISEFSANHASFPFIRSLPYKYLSYLGKNEKWTEFLTYFPNEPNSEKLRCYYYQAILFSGNWRKAWQGANKLWLKGTSVNSACDPLFDAWERAGGKTDAQILERMSLTYKKGNNRLLKILSKTLKYKSSQKIADKMLTLHRHSNKVGRYAEINPINLLNKRIVIATFKRLARKDIALAVQQYQQVVSGQDLNVAQRQALADFAAFRLFSTENKKLIIWRDKMIATTQSKSLLEFRIRLAIGQSDWTSGRTMDRKITT